MSKGTVKWFNNAKGWGFIEMENGEEAFVHYKDIQGEGFKALQRGEFVEFELVEGPKGPKAIDVEILQAREVNSQSV
ncbi:MAG: cold-shock protein [Phycisphaerae bacterium]